MKEKTTIRQRGGKLRIMSYNMENVIEEEGKYLTIEGKQVYQYGKFLKPPEETKGVVRNILSRRPDVIVGIEMGDLHAMMKLNEYGLDGLYFMIVVPGNDSRINVGFLIRKDLAVDVEIQSHREMMHDYLGNDVKLFSRDFPVLSFRDPGAAADSDPIFMIGGVHFKSQRMDELKPGEVHPDPGFVLKRTLQADATVAILEDYNRHYGGRVPLFIAGDFNADLNKGKEFKRFVSAGLTNAADLMGIPVGSIERSTHSYFPEGESPLYGEIDGFFGFGPSAKKIKKSGVVKELTKDGKEMNPPSSYNERDGRASDHRPLEIDLENLGEPLGARAIKVFELNRPSRPRFENRESPSMSRLRSVRNSGSPHAVRSGFRSTSSFYKTA